MAEASVETVSVRDLVEFVLRRGDLAGEGHFTGPARMLEGTRGHQRIQKSRKEGYEAEVPLSWRFDEGAFSVEVQGRVDGILTAGERIVIEEIKTVSGAWNGEARPLHWAQAKCYGLMYLKLHGGDVIDLQLTYLELESDNLIHFREPATLAELETFVGELVREYAAWMAAQRAWRDERDASLEELGFPFAGYRAGQRDLAVAVYRKVAAGGKLFAEAPTGIGKTMAVMFPALKALGEGKVDKVFYLTARTVGRQVAEASLRQLRDKGLKGRSVTLTAKDKICFTENPPCDATTCPYALGYYDRIKPALKDAFAEECLDRPTIEKVAERHQVCPFELSLDIATWADVVICDYNYAFDPWVSLKRFFAEESGAWALLVDEAHNLPDRAREMYSASLSVEELSATRKEIKSHQPQCAKALTSAIKLIKELSAVGWNEDADAQSGRGSAALYGSDWAMEEIPEKLLGTLKRFTQPAEQWLAQNEPAAYRDALLEGYFRVTRFVRTAEMFDECYRTLVNGRDNFRRVRLYCLDPSKVLAEQLKAVKAAVFFSATLSPMTYFEKLLGGDEELGNSLQLASPFPPENLQLLIEDRVATNYKQRELTLPAVGEVIASTFQGKRGNYLVFFPSHEYLRKVADEVARAHPELPLLLQETSMDESARERFLDRFNEVHQDGLIGFAVMGGIFGEGIDLVGDRLVGAIVVGVGLPQVCLERDLMREHFDKTFGAGFEFAYQWPGWNRVLQAAGRVIRTETDQGTVVLIDTRLREPRYRKLFPEWWHPRRLAGR